MKRIINRTWHFLCAQDSSYTWSDGWPVFFTHWGPGEPSNIADEGCVAMHGARFFHGTWNDTKCDLAKPYICKITTGTEKTDRVSVQCRVFPLRRRQRCNDAAIFRSLSAADAKRFFFP